MTSLRLFSLTFSALTFLACGEPAELSTSGPGDNNTQSSSTTQDPDPGTLSGASESSTTHPAGSTTTADDPNATTGLDTGTTTFPDPPDDSTTDSGDPSVGTTDVIDPGCGGIRCEADEVCAYIDDMKFCRPECHPLLADQCGADEVCTVTVGGFGCIPDTSGAGGAVGDPCDDVPSCDAGNVCLSSPWFADCDSPSCCSMFCDITQPDPCIAYGMVCASWYDEEFMAPPGLEDLGACASL